MDLPAAFTEERQTVIALLTAMRGRGASSETAAEVAMSITNDPDGWQVIILLGTLALEDLEAVLEGSGKTVEDWLTTTGSELATAAA